MKSPIKLISSIAVVGLLGAIILFKLSMLYYDYKYKDELALAQKFYIVKAGWHYSKAESLLGSPQFTHRMKDSLTTSYYYPTDPLLDALCHIEILDSTQIIQTVWYSDHKVDSLE